MISPSFRADALPGWPHFGEGVTSQDSTRHQPGPNSLSLLLSPVQLLSSLTECLTVDPLSTSVWRQLYPKHLPQSRQVAVVGWGVPALIHTEKPYLVPPSMSLKAEGECSSLFRFRGSCRGPLGSCFSAGGAWTLGPKERGPHGGQEDGTGRAGPLMERACAFPTACCSSTCSSPGSGFPRR